MKVSRNPHGRIRCAQMVRTQIIMVQRASVMRCRFRHLSSCRSPGSQSGFTMVSHYLPLLTLMLGPPSFFSYRAKGSLPALPTATRQICTNCPASPIPHAPRRGTPPRRHLARKSQLSALGVQSPGTTRPSRELPWGRWTSFSWASTRRALSTLCAVPSHHDAPIRSSLTLGGGRCRSRHRVYRVDTPLGNGHTNSWAPSGGCPLLSRHAL